MKPVFGHSFGRSWYMRLFHTPRTSFLLTTRLWKHNSCSGVLFIPGKNLRAPSRAFFEFLSASLSIKVPHGIKTSTKNFNGFSLLIAQLLLPAVGDVRCCCVLCNHCYIQIFDVTHDLLNGFVSGLSFSSPPLLPPSKSFLSPSPLGRPDTQINNNRSRYEIISAIQKEICQVL